MYPRSPAPPLHPAPPESSLRHDPFLCFRLVQGYPLFTMVSWLGTVLVPFGSPGARLPMKIANDALSTLYPPPSPQKNSPHIRTPDQKYLLLRPVGTPQSILPGFFILFLLATSFCLPTQWCRSSR